jgi:hypothetical protein
MKRKGPELNFRFETQKNLTMIRRAAKLRGVSMNRFLLGHGVRAAEEIIRTAKSPTQPGVPTMNDSFPTPNPPEIEVTWPRRSSKKPARGRSWSERNRPSVAATGNAG